MRPALLIPVAAGILLATALLPAPPSATPVQAPQPARGHVVDTGLDHWEQSDPPPELQPSPAPRNEVVVLMRDSAFEPRELNVPAGTVVKFLNRDPVAHGLTGASPGQTSAVPDRELKPGEELVLPLSEAGSYQLRCRYHSASYAEGMAMVLHVDRAA